MKSSNGKELPEIPVANKNPPKRSKTEERVLKEWFDDSRTDGERADGRK